MVHYSCEMLSSNSWWEERRDTGGTLYTDGVSYQAYYSEVGKAHYTKASTTEEPDAGKPHVRVCAGGAG